MTARQVVLWRHGQTAFNIQFRMQGQVDTELDEVGAEQALAAAPIIAADYRPDAIVTSDLRRAVRTADALADIVGLTPVRDERLRERGFGKWEGLTREEIQEQWPGRWESWRRGPAPSDIGIESMDAVRERAIAAIVEHADSVADGGTLVVVAHGALTTVATAALIGVPEGWMGLVGLSNAHFTVLVQSSRGVGKWRLLAHNVGVGPASEYGR